MNIYTQFMIGLAVGGSIGFLSSLIAFSFKTKGLKKQSRILLRNTFLREARAVLDVAQQQDGVANAVLLHVHNSGSELLANAFLYSSVIEESPESASVSVYKIWQRVPLDRQYSEVIDALHRSEYLFLHVDKMEESRLKTTYLHLGIRGSIVFRVYDRIKKSFIYVSFATKIPPNDVRWSREYAILLAAKDQLTTLCEKYHRKGVLQ